MKSKPFIGVVIALCLILLATVSHHPQEGTLAKVDGASITERHIEPSLGRQLAELNQQVYKLKNQKVNELIDAVLLDQEAKRTGVSVATLLERQVDDKVAPVSDEEIRSFYDKNKDRVRVDLEQIHDQIRDYLNDQRRESQKKEFLKELRSKAKITMYLKPPPIYRAEVPFSGAPIRGSEKAPVTIVKFEDFQCPFCKSAQPTFKELLKKYDGKVRVVHKDLPLETIHPLARQAAEAARCAGEKGKFWEYHDKLYAVSPKLSTDELKSSAREIGLDTAAFDQCFASGKYRGVVQKDLNDGAQLGLTGTPAFFINGREITGAQPLEAFAAVIDEELGQTQ